MNGGNKYTSSGELIKGNNNWSINHKGDVNNYLTKKGWTVQQIQETLNDGIDLGEYGTVLKEGASKGNITYRIHNTILNKSLILDKKTNQIIQLGQEGYKWIK